MTTPMKKYPDVNFQVIQQNVPRKQTGRERRLRILLGLICLITVGLICTTTFTGVLVKRKHDELWESENICNTRECAEAAGEMIKSMDMETSPCNNFYQFACGNWVKTHPLVDNDSWDEFNVLWDRLNSKVIEILKRDTDEQDPAPLNVAKKFYKTCLAQNSSQAALSDLLAKVLNPSQLNRNQLGSKLGELRRVVAANFILTLYVYPDEENTTNYRVYMDAPSLSFVQEDPGEHPHRTASIELIEELWGLLYPHVTNRRDVARRIMEFETELANISTKYEDRNKTYNPMTLDMLSNLTQNATMIDWKDYIRETFKDVGDELGDINTLVVIVQDIPFFQEIGHLLQKTIDEDEEILWNYLKWRLIWNYATDVSDQFRKIVFNYWKKTGQAEYPSARGTDCSDSAKSLFGMAITYDYVRDVFSSNFYEQMSEMTGNIREAYDSILDEIDWFGRPSTRAKAKVKAEKMRTFIGVPERLLDQTGNHSALLGEYFEGLIPENVGEDHLRNSVELWSRFSNHGFLRQIGRQYVPQTWNTDPTSVYSYFSQMSNSIIFPAGILQPPFYFPGNVVQALNYGAIGVVIGHQITHGFDYNRGRKYDGDGLPVDWWDEETEKQYIKRAQCFVEQYSNYTAEEADHMPLNGTLTLGENIADNGGLRQAFRAYQAFVKENGPEQRLPGLPYSPEQLFFIAFSQIYCGAYTKKGMETQIETSSSSPCRFRVRGALQNSVEFAQTWGCPLPDAKKGCRIW